MTVMIRTLLVVTTALVLAGCASVQRYQYYTLKPVAEPINVSSGKSLGVAPVKVPGWMSRSNLAINDGGFKIIRYDIHRWGEPLEDAVTRVVSQNLGLLFSQTDVITGPWLRSESPDRAIYIEITNLALVEETLELEANWYWVEAGNRSPVKREKLARPVILGSGPVEIVEGFSVLLAALSDSIKNAL